MSACIEDVVVVTNPVKKRPAPVCSIRQEFESNPLSPEEKIQKKRSDAKKKDLNRLSLKDLLGDYTNNFSEDLDHQWEQCDVDKNQLLD